MNKKNIIFLTTLVIVIVIAFTMTAKNDIKLMNNKLNTEDMIVKAPKKISVSSNNREGQSIYDHLAQSIDELKSDSEYILIGKVSNVEPHPSGSGFSSFLTVDVQNVIKGKKINSVKVLQMNDEYLASVGKKYIFFLKYYDKLGYFYITDGFQGIMDIDNDNVKINSMLKNNFNETKDGRVPLNILVNHLK